MPVKELNMRMWMIDPTLMCNQHLLGEHGEIHKHRHNFEKKHNMTGRMAFPSQIDPHIQEERHNIIAKEMVKRGMNHKSPYIQPDTSYLPKAEIDLEYNIVDLYCRCPGCAERMENNK
jgi:hypothetical protein